MILLNYIIVIFYFVEDKKSGFDFLEISGWILGVLIIIFIGIFIYVFLIFSFG